MKTLPEISVIMSVYNSGLHLDEAIESILTQTHNNFEFIIIDDGSSDNSREIITAYRDERLVVIKNDHNLGLAASLNKGAELARGEYLARMDADDISLPKRFQKQKEYLDQHPDIGILGTNAQRVDEKGDIVQFRYNIYDSPSIIRWAFLFGNPMLHPTIMMRKSCLFQVGGYSSDILYSQDYNLWIKMLQITDFNNLPDILLQYRIHSSNISIQHQQDQLIRSMENSRGYISQILGKKVTTEQAMLLRRQRNPENDNEVITVIRMIKELFCIFVADEKCTKNDIKVIRMDSWKRIFFFSKNLKKLKNQIVGFFIAFWLHPYVTVQRVISASLYKFKKRSYQNNIPGDLLW